jgi:anti-anti-sigma factor
MEVASQMTGDEIIIQISGRIDTTTSPKLQDEMMKSFQKGNQLVLDFKEVEYISSAGLRVLLMGQKTVDAKDGYMKIRHVNETVKNVFDMTGFTEMLTLEE